MMALCLHSVKNNVFLSVIETGSLEREESTPPNPSPLSPSCPQMFVRLFVDENLDRMVPISKQPKEKVQAIIDSCRRQFPEYQERARKRIRTYLKSCRRMKRSGFEMVSFDLKSSPSFHQNPPYVNPWHYFVFILVSLFICIFGNVRSEVFRTPFHII